MIDPDANTDTAALRAALDQAATDASIVLPDGYDVGEVLRDGVRAHGWWWGLGIGEVMLCAPRGAGYPVALCDGWRDAAQALWDTVGPGGPMPPLPGAGS